MVERMTTNWEGDGHQGLVDLGEEVSVMVRKDEDEAVKEGESKYCQTSRKLSMQQMSSWESRSRYNEVLYARNVTAIIDMRRSVPSRVEVIKKGGGQDQISTLPANTAPPIRPLCSAFRL